MYDNNFKVEGMVHKRMDAQQISERFRKREFVLSITSPGDGAYIDLVRFQCINNKIVFLDDSGEFEVDGGFYNT